MDHAERPRVVFDCNVYYQAVTSEDGPAARCLRLLDENRIELFVSGAVLQELRRVLAYPSLRSKNPDLTDERVAAFVRRLAFRASYQRRVRHVIDYPRAVQDEPYLDLAVAARAEYHVSRDRDLLALRSSYAETAKRLRRFAASLRIVDPVQFLSAVAMR